MVGSERRPIRRSQLFRALKHPLVLPIDAKASVHFLIVNGCGRGDERLLERFIEFRHRAAHRCFLVVLVEVLVAPRARRRTNVFHRRICIERNARRRPLRKERPAQAKTRTRSTTAAEAAERFRGVSFKECSLCSRIDPRNRLLFNGAAIQPRFQICQPANLPTQAEILFTELTNSRVVSSPAAAVGYSWFGLVVRELHRRSCRGAG